MDSTERIEVRKIYPGTAALVGLVYSLIAAFIIGIFVLISGLIAPGGIVLGTWQVDTISGVLYLSGIAFGFIFVLFFAKIFVGSLIYNWIARMGIRLDLGLAEHEEPANKLNEIKASV